MLTTRVSSKADLRVKILTKRRYQARLEVVAEGKCAMPRRRPCQGSAIAPRRTLSGLDTDRWDLGFLSPTIREWQHETKLHAPRRHFSIQRRAANEIANCVLRTRSSGSEDLLAGILGTTEERIGKDRRLSLSRRS